MKHKIFSLLILALPLASFATGGKKGSEQWITIGARGTFNSTWMLNKNSLHDDGVKYQPSFGGSGGIMLGFHATSLIAIDVEGLYSQYNQKMKYEVSDSLKWSSRVTLNYIEIPVLLRFDFENFKYLEFGPRFGFLNSVNYTSDPEPIAPIDMGELKKNYSSNVTGLVFGWGGGIWGNGGLLLSGGLRFTYGLSDIISEDGGRGDQYFTLKKHEPKSYQKTSLATVGFHLSADFDLGWMVRSSCGRTHKFVLFSH